MNKREMTVVVLLGGIGLLIPLIGLAAFAFVLGKVAATEYLVPVTAITIAGWVAVEIIEYLKWKVKGQVRRPLENRWRKNYETG